MNVLLNLDEYELHAKYLVPVPGRPDIFPDIADKLYHSLFDKILELPDFCEVLPAHGAGSLCGRAMGAKWRSTIGYEKKYNAPLQITDKDAFTRSLTEDMPPAPDHFSRCNEINREGPALVFGARFGDGCTSGHGISGTLQLAVSSWVSVIFFFIGGVITAHIIYFIIA